MKKSIDEKVYRKKLCGLDDRQESIQSVSQWILKQSNEETYPQAVSIWLETFRSITSDSKRLNLLYVANDVVQNCKRNKIPQLRSEFSKILKQVFSLSKNSPHCSSIGHIVDIWDSRGIFSPDLCSSLRSLIRYTKQEKSSNNKSSVKRKFDEKPVMQVKPMPKKQDAVLTSPPDDIDEWKKLPKDLFELDTTVAVLRKCSKRKRQLSNRYSTVSYASNLIDRLTSYGASDDTIKELFSSVEDMKSQIDSSTQCIGDFVELLTKKVKYDSYAIKCMGRAEHYLIDKYKERRDVLRKNIAMSATPLKLQAWVKAKKGMFQSKWNTSYPVSFSNSIDAKNSSDMSVSVNSETKSKSSIPVSSKSDLLNMKDLETVSDSESEPDDKRYSPQEVDDDRICSPPPLSRGIPIASEDESPPIESTPKSNTTVTYSSSSLENNVSVSFISVVASSYSSSSYGNSGNSFVNENMASISSQQQPPSISTISHMTPTLLHPTVLPPHIHSPSASISNISNHQQQQTVPLSPLNSHSTNYLEKGGGGMPKLLTPVPSVMITPNSSVSPQSSNLNSSQVVTSTPPQPPQQPQPPTIPNFLPPTMPPSFMLPPQANQSQQSFFSNPPLMPSVNTYAPPIPFPPPSSFPPPFMPPFLPPPIPGIPSSTTPISSAIPFPDTSSSLNNATTTTNNDVTGAININADVHAALSSLLGDIK